MMSQSSDAESVVFQQHLQRERDNLQAEISQLQAEIADKEMACRAKETRLSHIVALLATDSNATREKRPSQVRGKAGSTPTPRLLDMAVEVLRKQRGEPMHFREIAEALIGRGAVIKGKDPANGLLSRLTRDERFIRPTSKGFYALREDYPNARNVGAKRRGKQ